MSDQASAPALKNPGEVNLGLAAGVTAYVIWGFFPIYFKLIASVAPLEILAHRIVWAVPFGAIIIFMRKQWGEVISAMTAPRVLAFLGLSALTISVNWLTYIWAVGNGQILESSLGYFISPLMYVIAGVFILGEKLRPMQMAAIGLAAVGVAVLTFGVGVFPWVSFVLAISFTTYGYLRKTTPVGAMPGLFVETTLLAPIATIFVLTQMTAGLAAFQAGALSMDILLMLAGPLTVIPLVTFALAARRLTLTTLGLLQYIGPTLQFMTGLYFGETFTPIHAVSYGLIWIGIAIFSFDALRSRPATQA